MKLREGSIVAKVVPYLWGCSLLCSNAHAQTVTPFIQSISPVSAIAGSSNVSLTVTGAGFGGDCVIYWNGAPTRSGGTTTAIQLAIPPEYLATPGTARITVVCGISGSRTVSNVAYFSISTPESAIFTSRTDRPSGLYPSSQVAADFNGDGALDVAVAAFGDDTVTILLGDGGGGFRQKTAYPVGQHPGTLLTSDFNGDGVPDLALALNGANNGIVMLIGKGDGTFQPPVTYPITGSPGALAAGDFNRDGKVDLAIADPATKTAFVFPGIGDGTIQPPGFVPVASGSNSLALGDFDGDGILDMAVANENDNTVTLLKGNGFGGFNQLGVTIPMISNGAGGLFLTTADLNGDGKLDLAVASAHSGSLLILTGNGNGSFTSRYTPDSGSTPSGVSAVDFNGDGFIDLLVTSLFNGATVMPGDGSGGFTAPPLRFNGGLQPSSVIAADLDGDGRPDIVAANKYADNTLSSSSLTIFLQSALVFGPVAPGQSATAPITLTNSGASPLEFGSPGLSPSNVFRLYQGACPNPVGPSLTCDIASLLYGPQSTVPSSETATLTVPVSGVVRNVRIWNGIRPTQTLLGVSPLTSSVYGSPVTLSATVKALGVPPTGTISFLDGTAQIGQVSTDLAGRASFTISSLAAGSHSFTAVYAGGASDARSASVPAPFTTQQASLSITLSVPGSIMAGQPVPVAYTVQPQNSGTPTGTVTVTATPGGQSCSGTVSAGSCTLTLPDVSSQTLQSAYSGDANFLPSSTTSSPTTNPPTPVTVSKANTSTLITSTSPNPMQSGQAVKIKFTVKPSFTGTPTGTVTVSADTGEKCGPVTLVSGAGSCSMILTTAGTVTLTAAYGGDANFNGSTSPGVSQTVSDFSITATADLPTVSPGTTGIDVRILFKSKAAFNDIIYLTCSPDRVLSCIVFEPKFQLKGDYRTPATLAVSKSAKPGIANVTFTAVSTTGLTHSATVSLIVGNK